MSLHTAVTALLGIQHPVLSTPMAGISGGALAAAVTHAGGLDLIGGGYGDQRWLTRELKAAGNTRIGVDSIGRRSGTYGHCRTTLSGSGAAIPGRLRQNLQREQAHLAHAREIGDLHISPVIVGEAIDGRRNRACR